jgi:hypothetical protein
MATQEQITDFVFRRIAVGRIEPRGNWQLSPAVDHTGWPTVEAFAQALYQDAEFQALQLGGFFSTPTGEFLEKAVELAIPRAFAPEFELAVAALRLGAALQQGDKRAKAVALVGGAVLVGAVLKDWGKAA